MLQPISFETEKLRVHSFRTSDVENYKQLALEVLPILSDPFTLRFVPEKRLNNIEAAEDYIKTMFINHHVGRNHLHFIFSKDMDRVIGIVDLIAPKVVEEHYQLPEYPYFIEFYLLEMLSGRLVMTELLPEIIKEVQRQGIEKIAAVVNRQNKAAIKVLQRSGFQLQASFDIIQDLYLVSVSEPNP
ncbi:GNAT family N-acetyltransferase [Pedobacter steynii]|uniref:N-acetyltransferase domain-containing protein n=1 Tax=Pedobacter steynii TaxID=430522 RepID=A0A1D7QMX6_9SPHI|nr:GNAT family N-acetyltransferase [Pedobacter steynii]AOM80007.1 hypothetical protein BFS30_24310 [Pedobacter steynii]